MSKGRKKPSSKKSKQAAAGQPATAPTSTAATPSVRRAPAAPTASPAGQAPPPQRPTRPSAPSREPDGTPTNAPAAATPEQQRARFALERIQALAEEWRDDVSKQKEFNSHASAMPFMIRANGLGQTAAFYRRKGTDHVYYRLYALLGDWLAQLERPFAGQPDLLAAITQSDQDAYLAAQIEALLFLNWVKKLASAFLAREEDQTPATTATEATP